jgi:hypothetical protein
MLEGLWHSNLSTRVIKEMFNANHLTIYYALDAMISVEGISKRLLFYAWRLTLNIGHTLLQNLLEDLGILKFLLNL